MRLTYRCSACRKRRHLSKKIEHYSRAPKCARCGHARFYWDKERNKRRPACHCTGYWFPHRTGSPCCDNRADQEIHVRVRAGEYPLSVAADVAFEGRCASPTPPWELFA